MSTLTSAERERMIAGIAAYDHEQRVLLRLLRKRKRFTSTEFDGWFLGRKFRRSCRYVPVTGETFILGMGWNGGSQWAAMLTLLQVMVSLGLVAVRREHGVIVYSQP